MNNKGIDCLGDNGVCVPMTKYTIKKTNKTNADRIRSMSDEELAEFFSERDKIPNRYKCKEIEDWVKWLQSEAE